MLNYSIIYKNKLRPIIKILRIKMLHYQMNQDHILKYFNKFKINYNNNNRKINNNKF